ncbi:MAG: protein kinase [Alphaproteobacteria bacterium]|nr:protein kinase [Alphaproteobacteria bacterium]
MQEERRQPPPTRYRIGRYEIEEAVAEGSTAVVYRARDPAIGRTVAIKLLKTGPEADEAFLARFEREAQLAGAISHPNIVTIYDVGRVNGRPFITMEFLAEKSLAEVLGKEVRLPIKRVLSLGIQLARALDYAHRHGVVHRDIKPENILLLHKGETVKLTDFGVARLTRGEHVTKTQAGTLLGTPRYMSPEQATGKDADGRSDLFSLGAILYQLLTGRQPFDAPNLALLMLQIVQQDPPPVEAVALNVPQGLQRAVHKLLAKRPDQRFQTGAQLATVLERELNTLIAQEEEAARNRVLPLRLKLAIAAGGVFAVLFLSSMGLVYHLGKGVLRNHTVSAGAVLTQFVALHSAVPALSGDWLPLRVFVEDGRQRRSFDYLVIADHRNVVQAATESALVGKPLRAPSPDGDMLTQSDMTVYSATVGRGGKMFVFKAPILFQHTNIGTVLLGVSQSGVQWVLSAMFWLMLGLGTLAVSFVVALSQFIGLLILRPIRLLTRTLHEFGNGDLDQRISERRKDEIGQIYSAFNKMADKVQTQLMAAPPFPPAARTEPAKRPVRLSTTLDRTLVAKRK